MSVVVREDISLHNAAKSLMQCIGLDMDKNFKKAEEGYAYFKTSQAGADF